MISVEIQLPEIKFGKWYDWSKREKIESSKEPGVYLLAKDVASQELDKPANPLDKRIVYIGQTCGRKDVRSLQKRWKEFHNTVLKGEGNHAGGETYVKKYGSGERSLLGLFVAAMPVNLEKLMQGLFIKYVERKLLLEFALKHKELPVCNKE